MLSGAVTKAVNHCHSISSYPYFHINTKLVLCTGAAAHKRWQHVLMLSVVAGVCHPGSSRDSTMLLVPLPPTAGVTSGLNTPSGSCPEGPLWEKSPTQSRAKHLCDARGKLVILAGLSQPPRGTSGRAVRLLLATQVAKPPHRLGT